VKILIVDDNPINLKFLYYSLKRFYEIETASNGKEALQKLEKSPSDLVLMDLAMPIMDGVQATAAIRNSANKKISEIPVIFVTTNDFEHEKQRCFDAGATDYMLKPIDAQTLLAKIEDLLQPQYVKM
jgi:CheY-like chemotaxis protein